MIEIGMTKGKSHCRKAGRRPEDEAKPGDLFAHQEVCVVIGPRTCLLLGLG